ncbi:MAG TPA: erythromycin esterase family protein [Mycobacteriales bacterium]|nr:erythromycin esterase family protein [Mycobacteriales bacterium]
MADSLFRDRRDAGRVLAGLLARYAQQPDVLVLGLPRGGVPVAYEVATALGAPLDVFVVRKLGAPGQEELAMGALAGGGVVVIDDDVVRALEVTPQQLQEVARRESAELARREQEYREGRPEPDVAGRTVIVVDDGLATGASMRAAIEGLKQLGAGDLVVAVPAAPESTCRELKAHVEDVVCATTPTPFSAVGAQYWDFAQTTDEEVRELLRAAATTAGRVPAPASDAEVLRLDLLPTTEGVPPDVALFDLVGDAHLVLIGEASHGTHEFYEARARMTRRLIEEKGFRAVAVEGDWPDAYRVNRYVRGRSGDGDAEEALRGFERFPTWMWRNTVVVDFVGWLRERNERAAAGDQTGFYGLDVYSLHRSIREVITYLETVDPEAAARARERYSCFDHHDGEDGQAYGFAAAYGAGDTCEQQIVDQLVEMQGLARDDGVLDEDESFAGQQNAKVVKAAAEYYRGMFSGRVNTWNLRDTHMVDTLDSLAAHLTAQRGAPAKIVVWEHNSHLGDARATESRMRGELNVGQLVRERHPGDCRSIGFTTYAGTVTAADDWGGAADRKNVRPGLPGSVEALLHEVGVPEFMLSFPIAARAAEVLGSARLERAIGVIYRPQTERQSHYFRCRLSQQFDAVVHLDETRALEPLERTARWEAGEVPETYPYAV